jgi:hypothetical protein
MDCVRTCFSAIYFFVIMLMSSLSIILSVVVLNFHARFSDIYPMNRKVRTHHMRLIIIVKVSRSFVRQNKSKKSLFSVAASKLCPKISALFGNFHSITAKINYNTFRTNTTL